MRNYNIPILAGITLTFLIQVASGRPMRTWTPAELFERSEIVVVGKPTSVTATGETGKIQLGKNAETPVRFYSAKVQVIAAIKGEKVAKEITVKFSTVSSEKPQINGAMRFWLGEGQLFLLYLKKADEDIYVGVLDGDFDDGPASVLLPNSDTEQDADDQLPARAESEPE
ncbi:MAG: hypothetical protein HKN23_05570 [Verrucomicrobiales bacterium]|nr:hypothetical protein [Verrucomicrobiales bacterium]